MSSNVNIVLFQPEIPYNTGNAIRSCATFGANLHLIRPYGFFLNNKKMLRASTDYLDKIQLNEHNSFNDFMKTIQTDDLVFFLTKKGQLRPDKLDLSLQTNKNVYFVFGQETNGLPNEILDAYYKQTIRIPIANDSRCLNLSNTVACMLYEVARQNNFANLRIDYAPEK